jgi:hypothetical protein
MFVPSGKKRCFAQTIRGKGPETRLLLLTQVQKEDVEMATESDGHDTEDEGEHYK